MQVWKQSMTDQIAVLLFDQERHNFSTQVKVSKMLIFVELFSFLIIVTLCSKTLIVLCAMQN